LELDNLRNSGKFSFEKEIVNSVGFTNRPNTLAITFDRYKEIREGIIECLGISRSGERISGPNFDRKLIENWDEIFFDLNAFDASRSGVWSFLTLRVLFDVALLRFPDNSDERYLGKNRNVFWRLYQRRELLGPELSIGLLEDEMVQIMERTALLGSSPKLAKAIARSIISNREISNPKTELSLAVRETIKDLRRDLAIVAHEAISEAELEELVNLRLMESITLLSAKKD
jgi:hypothetical protein